MFAAGRAWEQVRNSVAYPAPERQGRRLPRRPVRRRGRRDPPVHRGSGHHARHPRHDGRCAPATATRCAQAVRGSDRATTAPPICAWAAWRWRPSRTTIPGYKFELGKGAHAARRQGRDHRRHGHDGPDGPARPPNILAAEGISARVIDMHTIKPLDTELAAEGRQGDRRHRHQRRGTTSSAAWAAPWPSTCRRALPRARHPPRRER